MNLIRAASFSLVFILIAGLVGVGLLMAWGQTNTVKDAAHTEAPTIRSLYRDDACAGTEVYYSTRNGTLLILCGISNSKQWGGIIWRVTENNGNFILDDMYEVTVFAAERRYWNNVIKRDIYIPVYIEPSLHKLMRDSY